MSVPGQKAKYLLRAHVFRCSPDIRHSPSERRGMPKAYLVTLQCPHASGARIDETALAIKQPESQSRFAIDAAASI
jgi:hypothetical protein